MQNCRARFCFDLLSAVNGTDKNERMNCSKTDEMPIFSRFDSDAQMS